MVWKKRPPKQAKKDLDFPWEVDSFREENTADYPELAGTGAFAPEKTEDRGLDVEPDADFTDRFFEDTDQHFTDMDPAIEDTSEILEAGEDRKAAASRSAAVAVDPTPGERFFPDVPELAKNEEDSAVSGLLRTADEISRIITLNRPRPGPFLHWYFSLDRVRRRRVYKGMWMLSASTAIITLFTLATVVVFPLLEERFTASFGPRPDLPVRWLPEAGAPFALVEDRLYRHDRFIAGMDCIWVTSDPVLAPKIASFGPFLVDDGEMIAVLDVQETWNGMLRLYFERGEVPPDEPVYLVIPLEGGGTVPLDAGPGYRVATAGGAAPARVVLGPVTFKEDLNE
jgi:hypothetical protein